MAKEDSLLNPRPDPPTIEKTTIEHTTKDARRITRRRAFRGVSRKGKGLGIRNQDTSRSFLNREEEGLRIAFATR